LIEGTKVFSSASADEGNDSVPRLADGRAEMPRGDGWDGFPVRGTYADGVAWIVMILARALAYAHRMRTYHRDVKPGNVLLTLQHGPQLLDFNLAESPHSVSQAEAAMHGGTLPYMAPEQLGAFLNPELWGKVGSKADIYSLGLVLRELLTGQAPDLPAQTLSPPRALRVLLDRRPMLDVSVRGANPAIPHALEAIVAKCLAVAPDDRYPTAQALAEDLDRFLKGLPLVCTTNPSRSERLGNWVRRRRWALATIPAYLLLFGVLVFGTKDRVRQWLMPLETNPRFHYAVEMTDDGKFDEAKSVLRDLVAEYPDSLLAKLHLSFALDAWKDQDNESCASGDTELSPEIDSGASGDTELSLKDYRPIEEVEADILLTQVMKASKSPDVHAKLITWAQGHPKFASHLEAAGLARFDRGDKFTQDTTEKDYDRRRAEFNRRFLHHLARPALKLAAELNPKSTVACRLLAIILEDDKQYWSAYEQISPAFDALEVPAQNEKELFQLYKATTVRARLATTLADHPEHKPPNASPALELMQQAVEDLTFSEGYVNGHRDSVDKTHFVDRSLYVLCIKGPAYLTLSEIETGLRKISEAKAHFRVALDTFDRIEKMRSTSANYRHYWKMPSYRTRASDLSDRLLRLRPEDGVIRELKLRASIFKSASQRLQPENGDVPVQPDPDTSWVPSAARSNAAIDL
jgi:serine/threonine protein kinase